MKTLFTLVIGMLLWSGTLQAQTPEVKVTDINTRMSADDRLHIGMNLTLPAKLKVTSNHMMTFTPVLKSGNNECVLTPVYIYGRKRAIINRRNNRTTEGGISVRRTNRREQTIAYEAATAYEPWMSTAEVVLEKDLCGCGNLVEDNNMQLLAQVSLPEPEKEVPLAAEVAVVQPQPKKAVTRILNGKAFIDFPINKTIIYPQYRKNQIELARIDSTLQGINLANIQRIRLHGYASPESPYSHNTKLAQGRTEALKQYLMDKYKLDESIFILESTPEDWEGFIRLAEACDFPEKERILEIARSHAEPDQKETQLRRLIDAYLRMSQQWFPTLRHTDYQIEYVVMQESSNSL